MSEAKDSSPNALVRVRTLLGRRDVPLMLNNWQTLVRCSAEPFETVVHDDGSLTPTDEDAIAAVIPRSRILWRTEADARLQTVLARHQHARSFRAASLWSLKLLDVVLAEPGDCYYIDADVRFLRPFRGLFTRATLANRVVFFRDPVWTSYSVRPWHLWDRRGLRLVEGINTGITFCDRACFDLDFVDWFLRQPDWRVIPAWTELTCWAALAARADGHAFAPEQMTNFYPQARVTSETVAAHFLSSFRAGFATELTLPPRLTEPPVEIRVQRLRPLGAVALAGNQLKRKLTNEWKRSA